MAKEKKGLGLSVRMLLGLALGAAAGFALGERVTVIAPIGTVFLRLLRMTILPLVFFSIVNGVAAVADLNRLKRVGIIFVKYWLVASLLAAMMGLFWAFVINPGGGISMPVTEKVVVDVDLVDSLVKWIPDNVSAAFAQGNTIQIIVFAMFTGVSIVLLSGTKSGELLGKLFEAGADLMGRMVGMVMKIAPIGVFCLMANVTGTLGGMVLGGIGKMLVTQYVAYAMMLGVVYPLILKFWAHVSPLRHYQNILPVMTMAFSTQSSSATLPVTMESTKKRCGVPEDIVNLIAAPAATINMHACAAEMPIYAVFASQIYGIDLSLTQLLVICVLGVIMAAGVAGVPGGGIMMSAVLLEVMGLPLDIVPWIAGIYVLIDMPNTMLNVTGDTVGMVYTADKLGELDREVFYS